MSYPYNTPYTDEELENLKENLQHFLTSSENQTAFPTQTVARFFATIDALHEALARVANEERDRCSAIVADDVAPLQRRVKELESMLTNAQTKHDKEIREARSYELALKKIDLIPHDQAIEDVLRATLPVPTSQSDAR